MSSIDRRDNHDLRRLITAGDMAATLAATPEQYSAEYREQISNAWKAALVAIRKPRTGEHHAPHGN